MSLDVNYVSDWGIQDAIRELFQNAIDYGNWDWDYIEGTLKIISKGASLPTASLLLGHSRKNDGAIGKFGEGYKLAMLVLTRLGYVSYIHNRDEIWRPKLINSRTYKTQQLVFDTSFASTADNLVFCIEGLSESDFLIAKYRNLHLEPTIAWEGTSKGVILPDRPGAIFVGGLWVCDLEEFKYGYNFSPTCMTLDRDRRLVRAFDVSWLTCQMWAETHRFEEITSLIKEDAPDTKYLDSFLYNTKEGLADEAAKSFLVEHGENAIAVSSQHELKEAQEQQHENIVLVKPLERQLITRSVYYTPPPPPKPKKSPREYLIDYRESWKHEMSTSAYDQFNHIIEQAENWVKV